MLGRMANLGGRGRRLRSEKRSIGRSSGLGIPFLLLPRNEQMLPSSWISRLQQTFSLRRGRKPRRRVQQIGLIARCAQVEQLETRSLLSAPAIVLSPPGPLNYVENSGAVVIAPNSTVTDAGVVNFNGGTLTESLTANANAADQLGIRNQGSAAGQIGIVGNNVQFGGVTIGTFTGGGGSTPLVVTFN